MWQEVVLRFPPCPQSMRKVGLGSDQREGPAIVSQPVTCIFRKVGPPGRLESPCWDAAGFAQGCVQCLALSIVFVLIASVYLRQYIDIRHFTGQIGKYRKCYPPTHPFEGVGQGTLGTTGFFVASEDDFWVGEGRQDCSHLPL